MVTNLIFVAVSGASTSTLSTTFALSVVLATLNLMSRVPHIDPLRNIIWDLRLRVVSDAILLPCKNSPFLTVVTHSGTSG
mmetsp:Transcript_25272/g.55016  ORF Transcript_25272/g.55016 Transcript_25272/m.55016 type:complete len:80 (+) Transcript_25272:159-398(+)